MDGETYAGGGNTDYSQPVESLAYEDHPSTDSTDICMYVVSAVKYSGLSMPMRIVRDYYCYCYCYFHLAPPVYSVYSAE